MQLIKALQGAGKHFEVQVGPDEGHSQPNWERTMEFLIHSLVVKPRDGLAYWACLTMSNPKADVRRLRPEIALRTPPRQRLLLAGHERLSRRAVS